MVCQITDREKVSIYGLRDTCMKTCRLVLKIMREKHPEHTIPAEVNFDKYDNVNRLELLDLMPLFFCEENVSSAAARLRGGAGPYGGTGRQLKEWLLRHKVSSELLHREMALWANLLANSSPCYASYRALNTG